MAARDERDWDCTNANLFWLVGLSDAELASIDPLVLNLVVAKGIPALAEIDIRRYQEIVDALTADFCGRCLPQWEPYFYKSPQDYKSDIRYFRLGMVCQYLEIEAGIEYKRDQRNAKAIYYTSASDLFLNGVLDSREGTCANLAALQHAVGWRLGWPVSIACLNSHFILRFDDGETIYNIEATQSGHGGFKSDPDTYLIEQYNLPEIAIASGSDLRALRPREVLGSYIGLRARHLFDLGRSHGDESQILSSEADWLLARHLFTTNRALYKNQTVVSALRAGSLFARNECGHPETYASLLCEVVSSRARNWRPRAEPDGAPPQRAVDEYFSGISVETKGVFV